MKILDRYVLATFLKNYLISFAVLVGMFITIDMVINFDEVFALSNNTVNSGGFDTALRLLRNLTDFYFYKSILIFVYLSPIIPVLAAAFTMLRMTRFNELIATLAAGQPLLRTAMPIIVATAVLTTVTWPLQELVIPSIIPKLDREHRDVGRDTVRSYPVKALEDAAGNILVAARFTPATPTAPAALIELDMILRDEQRRPIGHILADRAAYDPKFSRWMLTNGRRTTGLQPELAQSRDTPEAFLPSSITPEEIALYRSRDFVDLLSTSRIDALLTAPRNYGVTDLLRVKHFRVTQYINSLILLLLTLPCVMTREPRSLKTGGAFLMGVVGAYLGSIFIAQHLAGTPSPIVSLTAHWPALMAWFPVLTFGPAAIFALDRIKT